MLMDEAHKTESMQNLSRILEGEEPPGSEPVHVGSLESMPRSNSIGAAEAYEEREHQVEAEQQEIEEEEREAKFIEEELERQEKEIITEIEASSPGLPCKSTKPLTRKKPIPGKLLPVIEEEEIDESPKKIPSADYLVD